MMQRGVREGHVTKLSDLSKEVIKNIIFIKDVLCALTIVVELHASYICVGP